MRKMCENDMVAMAKADFGQFLAIVKSGELDFIDQTFALEYLGQYCPENYKDDAAQVLCDNLSHEKPLLREGAIYGLHLIDHLETYDYLIAKLEKMAIKDPLNIIRTMAKDLLEYIDKNA